MKILFTGYLYDLFNEIQKCYLQKTEYIIYITVCIRSWQGYREKGQENGDQRRGERGNGDTTQKKRKKNHTEWRMKIAEGFLWTRQSDPFVSEVKETRKNNEEQ